MFWRKKSRESEIQRELRAHLELEAEEQQNAGLSPEACAEVPSLRSLPSHHLDSASEQTPRYFPSSTRWC